MKRKRSKAVKWGISILIIIGIIIGGVYYSKRQKTPAPVSRGAIENTQPLPEEPTRPAEENLNAGKPEDHEDPCLDLQTQVNDFFMVLDRQGYIKQIKPGINTYDEFRKIMGKLSANPPSPAGEGLDPRKMMRNIFYFFRVLNDTELRLVKETMNHEDDTLEMNLRIFYKWLTLDQCPDPDKIRPSFPVIYSLSGFFVNTIGGRAYLFRRPPRLRQLVEYYALLTIHEADKKGQNTYGIDIFPEVRSLAKEMADDQDLMLQQEYVDKLNTLLVYYQDKR